MNPQKTLRDLESEALLSVDSLEAADSESLVEMRSRPEFESKWLEAFESVDAAWDIADRSSLELECIKRIREVSFKRVFASTGNDDLAAMISDDFDIICRGALLSVEIPFLGRLTDEYYSGRIPK